MAATSVPLFGIGEIADWIDKSVSDMLTRVITPMIADVTEGLLPFVSVGLSIALIWYGWLIASGAIQTPVLAAARKLVNSAIIITIAGAGGLYQTEIIGVMLELPADVASAFTGTHKTPAQLMDDAANKGSEIGTRLQQRAPTSLRQMAQAFLFVLVALIITVISVIMSAIGMLVLITVKVGMGLVVVMGPFCILGLLFEATKEFFKAWLRQAFYYTFYAGLFMVVFMFIMGMFGMLQQGLLDLSQADTINIFSMLTAIIFFMVCAKYMLEQVSSVASQVTGGRGGGISVPYLGKIG